ncbi:hypothetical protein GE300_01805 [Rhodobacteraceae bacterium 2CG4]|uniref:Uncharacterized protein n=1 Tax=Halovulum marinum TaxID=2662447 RepID=A0A6L5YWJ4_9RHOB|nr:hypothetical protein [Halovulum marinum]MSU88350.1 hypothetical protein [Halovulum marinum]
MTAAEDAWDWEHQQAVTRLTVQRILSESGLAEGVAVELDLDFVPTDAADRAAAVRKLGMFGYGVEAAEDGALRVAAGSVPLEADAIWQHEERTSRIALIHGYEPDGWGFAEP